MIETLLDFSGLEDISRDLQLLSGAENNRVLREATRAGANVLKEEVVSRAPVRRGKLRRNVVVLSRRSRDGPGICHRTRLCARRLMCAVNRQLRWRLRG